MLDRCLGSNLSSRGRRWVLHGVATASAQVEIPCHRHSPGPAPAPQGVGPKAPSSHGPAPGHKQPSAHGTQDPNVVGQRPWGSAQVSGVAARLRFSCSATHSMILAERLVLLAMEPMAKISADEAATPKDIIIAPENSAPTSPPNRIKAATTWQNAPVLLPLELTSFDVRSPWTWLGVETEELEGKLFSG